MRHNLVPLNVKSALDYVPLAIIFMVSKREHFIFAGKYRPSIRPHPTFRIMNLVMYRQEHACTQQCAAPGICEINTAPLSVESTFQGAHETFQYTKVTSYFAQQTSYSLMIRHVSTPKSPVGYHAVYLSSLGSETILEIIVIPQPKTFFISVRRNA